MIKNSNREEAVLELNEWVEKWSEVKPHLDALCGKITVKRVRIANDGADEWLVRKCAGYLENHGIAVSWS